MTKLAVVIPALNEENLILKTLESLNLQSRNDFTLILVDNNSTDSTVRISNNFEKRAFYPITILSEKHAGVGYARNSGMQKALELGALYIAGTDADTIVPYNWIESIYHGFTNTTAELLCGNCDPLKEVKFNHKKSEFVLKARDILAKEIKPYFRGANYAITSEMFKKVGSIKQPVTKDGKPAPGEDGQLELDVLRLGGQLRGCLATVVPHPRRYISNLANIKSYKGSVHEGGVVTQVRNEDSLERMLRDVPTEVLDQYADRTLVSLFIENIIYIYKEPLFKAQYWDRALKMLEPFSSTEVEADIATCKDTDYLWNKYGVTFLKNISKFI